MSSVVFLGPQNAPKSLADGALPDPLAGFKGTTTKGRGGEKRRRVRQNDLCPWVPETFTLILEDTNRNKRSFSTAAPSVWNFLPTSVLSRVWSILVSSIE